MFNYRKLFSNISKKKYYRHRLYNNNIFIILIIKMEHQDWKSITFNNVSDNKKREQAKKIHSNKTSNPEEVKLEQQKNLGQLIAQARNTKNLNQKQLAAQVGVSSQILGRWESNKEVLTNAQIASIEKITGVKLPRNKKVSAKQEN